MSMNCQDPISQDSLSLGRNVPSINGSSEATVCCWYELDSLPDPAIHPLAEAAFFEISVEAPFFVSRVAFELRNPAPSGSAITLVCVLRAPDGSAQTISAGPGTATAARTHVAVTINLVSQEVRFYSNGQRIVSIITTVTGPAFTDSDSNFVAVASSDANVDEFIDGRIEDVRVYNRALSDNEIKTIFACQGIDGIVFGLRHRFELQSGNSNLPVLSISAQDSGPLRHDASVATGNPMYRPSIGPTYRRRVP